MIWPRLFPKVVAGRVVAKSCKREQKSLMTQRVRLETCRRSKTIDFTTVKGWTGRQGRARDVRKQNRTRDGRLGLQGRKSMDSSRQNLQGRCTFRLHKSFPPDPAVKSSQPLTHIIRWLYCPLLANPCQSTDAEQRI